MRLSALALTSTLGVGIPITTSTVVAADDATKAKGTEMLLSNESHRHHRRAAGRKRRRKRRTEAEKKKVTRQFQSRPESLSAAKYIENGPKMTRMSNAPSRSFEVCQLSSRSRRTSATGTNNSDLDLGILGECSSEDHICILPDLIGLYDSPSPPAHYYGYDGYPIVDYNLEEQFYSKIAMGICYPRQSMNAYYLAAVVRPMEDGGSDIGIDNSTQVDSDDSIDNSTQIDSYNDIDNTTQANSEIEVVEANETDISDDYIYDYMSDAHHNVGDIDTSVYIYSDDEILPGFKGHNRDLLSIPSAFKRLRSKNPPERETSNNKESEIEDEISRNAITQKDAHYLQCQRYCSTFDRPQVNDWLSENTPAGNWPLFEELVARCVHAYHYEITLGFDGIPHNCPFDTGVPMNCWNMTGVTTLETAFRDQSSFNRPLDCWDTSAVTSTQGLFKKAYAFNQDISWWDLSRNENMAEMFYFAVDFNQNLNKWYTGRVTDISRTFFGSNMFNSPIGFWDMSNVQDMYKTFFAAVNFNQTLGNWDTSSLTALEGTFTAAMAFNQPLASWNMTGVTSLNSAFMNSNSFNQPLNEWDVSNVVNMDYTFLAALSFNQPLDANSNGDPYWNVRSATTMKQTFFRTPFDQCIGTWAGHLSAHDSVDEKATYGMFYESQCKVEMELGTPPIAQGPWCQDESQGCTTRGMVFSSRQSNGSTAKSRKSKSSKGSKGGKGSKSSGSRRHISKGEKYIHRRG